MKTRNLILFAAAMVAASCAKEIVPEESGSAAEPVLVPMEFTASVETKAGLIEDGKTVNWNDNESICLFDNLGGDQQFTAATGGASAYFSGNVTEGSTEFYALYPYIDAAEFSTETMTIKSKLLPDQKAVKGSYALGSGGAVMVAKADADNVLSFKNMTSHIKFTLAEDMTDVKSITLMGNKSEKLCGTYSVAWTDGEPVLTITNPETYVTLRNEDGTALVPGDYYFTVFPVEFTEGFTVILSKVETGDQVAKKTTKSITTLNKRNQILPMAPLASGDYSAHMNYFVKYNDGFDITIGGYKFNKTDHPDGVLVNDTKGNGTLNSDGLYFVESTATSAKFTSVRKVNKYMVIGADADSRSKLEAQKAIRPLTDGTILMFANIDYTPTPTNYIVHHNENKFERFGSIVFSNCHVRNIRNHFMTFNLVDWTLDNLVIEDCEFEFNKASAYVLNCSEMNSEIGKMTFRNNVFYVSDDMTMTDFRLTSGSKKVDNATVNTLTVDNVVVDKNTFVNTVVASNILNIAEVNSTLNFHENLFVGCSGESGTVKLIRITPGTNNANVTGRAANNYYYTTGVVIGLGIGKTEFVSMPECFSTQRLAASPLNTLWKPSAGIFGPYTYGTDVSNKVGAWRSDMKVPEAPSDVAAANYVSINLGTL